jgi:hypothetical protein
VNNQIPPSQLIKEIKQKLDAIQRNFSNIAEHIGYASEVADATEPVWQAMDSAIKQDNPDDITTSGYQVLNSFYNQVSDFHKRSMLSKDLAINIGGSVNIVANTAGSTASFADFPIDYDPKRLERFQYSFENHDDYADKLAKLNPSMAETFRGVKQSYLIKSEDHIRKALFATRQVFDQLFDALALDPEVRDQSWWKPEDPEKPEMVTRPQRIKYAAQKYVYDDKKKQILMNGVDHLNKVYNKLNMLHARGPVDEQKAKATVLEMLGLIREWVDSINVTSK